MAVGMLLAGEAVTENTYRQVTEKMFGSYPMREDQSPDGLILHVAGPTDEGFRTIEIWETREAWERCRAARSAVPTPSLIVKPTLRALEAPTALGRLVGPRIEVPSTHQPKEEA